MTFANLFKILPAYCVEDVLQKTLSEILSPVRDDIYYQLYVHVEINLGTYGAFNRL